MEGWPAAAAARTRRSASLQASAAKSPNPFSRLHWLPQAVPPTAGEYRAQSAGRDFRKGGRGDGEGQSGIGIRYSVAEVGKERDSLC
jgi:hypothetical protein